MRLRTTLAGLLVAIAALSGCSSDEGPPDSLPDEDATVDVPSPTATLAPDTGQPKKRPNIVFVLMDDFSMDLWRTMRQGQDMQRKGAWYPNSFVTDSLCCVSRSTTFTGQYPHQTGVLINTNNLPNPTGEPIGGWKAFERFGNRHRTFAVRMQQSGYTTGFVGKYLNEYETDGEEAPQVPPGWSDWRVVFGSAYDGWKYQMMKTDTDTGKSVLTKVPKKPFGAPKPERDKYYATNVISDNALDFIDKHKQSDNPFFLEVSVYGPHSRVTKKGAYPNDPKFPAAFADRPTTKKPQGNCGPVNCHDFKLSWLPGYNDDRKDNRPRYPDGSKAKAWQSSFDRPYTDKMAHTDWADRARMVQSIDRMVAKIRAAVPQDTYVVLTSDNGFHLGQYKMQRGKGLPYRSDSQVPLVVTGPGVRPGTRDEVVSNLDLATTFEDMASLKPPPYRSGVSLLPSLQLPGFSRQDYAFIEHTWARSLLGDPDRVFDGGSMNQIPSYVAVRSRNALLVRWDLDNRWTKADFAYEFYDYNDVGWEKRNQFNDVKKRPQVRELMAKLREFDACAEQAKHDDPVGSKCRWVTQRTTKR